MTIAPETQFANPMPTYTPTAPATLQPATEYELVALPNGCIDLVPFPSDERADVSEIIRLVPTRKETEMANDSHWPEYDPQIEEYVMQSAVTGRMHYGQTVDECLDACHEADRVWAEHQSRAHNRLAATNAEAEQQEADHD